MLGRITQVTVARTNRHGAGGRQRRPFEVRITSNAELDENEIAHIAQLAADALSVDPSHVSVIVPSTVVPGVIRALVESASQSLREQLDAGKPDSGGEIAVTCQHEA